MLKNAFTKSKTYHTQWAFENQSALYTGLLNILLVCQNWLNSEVLQTGKECSNYLYSIYLFYISYLKIFLCAFSSVKFISDISLCWHSRMATLFCYNRGCTIREFKVKDNHDEACLYHPGKFSKCPVLQICIYFLNF